MNYTKITFFLLLISSTVFSQSNNDKARAYFIEAKANYESANYSQTIENLELTENLLGSTNPMILNLKVKTFYELKEFEKAKKSLDAFSKAKNSKTGQSLIDETLSYFIRIDKGLKDELDREEKARLAEIERIENERLVEIERIEFERLAEIERKEKFRIEREIEEKKRDLINQERAVWFAAKDINTRESYWNYLEKYPKGIFMTLANVALKQFPPRSLVDVRDGNVYKTVRIGEQVWMAENLRYNTVNSLLPPTKFQNRGYGHFYTKSERYTACPKGWHLPKNDEVKIMLNYLGISYSRNRSENGFFREEFRGKNVNKLIKDDLIKKSSIQSIGFNSLYSGYVDSDNTFSKGKLAWYWTYEGNLKIFARLVQLDVVESSTGLNSCRCIKD